MSCEHEGPFTGICIHCADAEVAALKAEIERLRALLRKAIDEMESCWTDLSCTSEDIQKNRKHWEDLLCAD